MNGHGIKYRLQGYVPGFGATVTNAFDLQAWHRATTLESFGVELFVRAGAVLVTLQHVAPDGTRSDFATLDCPGPGSTYSPPILMSELVGALIPIVTHASDDAEFDLYFGTNDRPLTPEARVCYILNTSPARDPDSGKAQGSVAVFHDYLKIHQDHDAAHLAVIDNGAPNSNIHAGPDCENSGGTLPDAHVTVLPNNNTGGAGGFGRGLYEACYGALANQSFTHVCLFDDGGFLHPEMFARNTAFVRFLRPGFHVGAPTYPTSPPDQPPDCTPRTSICCGYKFRGTLHPDDDPLGVGQDTGDIAAFVKMDREPQTTGWWWDCMAVSDIHRIGLPYPFFNKMGDVEYSLRLRSADVDLVIPFSFWVLRDNFKESRSTTMGYFRFRNRWVLLAQQGRLEDVQGFRNQFWSLVRGYIARSQYEQARLLLNAMSNFLKGPEYLIERDARRAPEIDFPVAQRGSAVTAFWLKLRLKLILKRVAFRLRSGLGADYKTARDRLTTIGYWSQIAGNQPAADPTLHRTGLSREITGLQRQLNASHLEIDRLRRSIHQTRREITDMLHRNQLLHTPQILADLERANLMALSLLHNRHAGQRAFIVGNGPSLKIADLDRLRGEVTFASNKIFLAFDNTDWRPTYYSVEDSLVLQSTRNQIAALQGTTKIFPANMRDFDYDAADTIFVPFRAPKSFVDPLSDSDFPDFSTDLRHGICWGSSIVYSQIQMALFMGCSELFLIGLDHSYHLPSVKHGQSYISEGEQNHFHPNYRVVGEKWHQPNLKVLDISFLRARDRCAERGVRILNASRRSQLQVFDLVNFDTLF